MLAEAYIHTGRQTSTNTLHLVLLFKYNKNNKHYRKKHIIIIIERNTFIAFLEKLLLYFVSLHSLL